MQKKITPLLLIVFVLLTAFSYAQQIPYYGNLQENWIFFNPAFVNHAYLENDDNIFLLNLSRRQNLGKFGYSPVQNNVRIENISEGMKTKWGLGFTQETLSSFLGWGAYGNYAYTVKINNEWSIAGGLSLHFQSQEIKLNPDEFENYDTDLFAQQLDGQISHYLSFDGGIYISRRVTRDKSAIDCYGGISAVQFANVPLPNNSGIVKVTHWNGFFGGIIKGENEDIFFEPAIWVRYLPRATFYNFGHWLKVPVSADLSLKWQLDPHFWIRGGYSTAGSFNGAVGCVVDRDRKINLGILINSPRPNLGTTVESFLSFQLN